MFIFRVEEKDCALGMELIWPYARPWVQSSVRRKSLQYLESLSHIQNIFSKFILENASQEQVGNEVRQ